MQSRTIRYYVKDKLFILQLEGKLRFLDAPDLEKVLHYLEKFLSVNEVIIDMAPTLYVDSTILGSIIQFFLQPSIKERFGLPTLICFDGDVLQNLHRIGFNQLFNIEINNYDERILAANGNWRVLSPAVPDKNDLRDCMQRSHETLNVWQPSKGKFEEVIKSLKSNK